MSDGVHPNITGYALMVDVWFDTLQEDRIKPAMSAPVVISMICLLLPRN